LGAIGILAYIYTLSPLPWQWTGNELRMAPLFRGGAQALIWNLLWLGLLIAPFAFLDLESLLGDEFMSHLKHWGYPRSSPALVLTAIGKVTPIAMLVGWFLVNREATEAERAELEEVRRTLENAARQAQVQALQAQLDPHMLYNALSGISELIREDPERAEEAVLSLSALYRRLTALGRRSSLCLLEERELIEAYLSVEQVRLGLRLKVVWDWPTALDECAVAPLLIQPLVENAIKHGLAPLEEGGELRISARKMGDGRICISIANNGKSLDPDWREGTGLSNLFSRLALLGAGSSLELRQEGRWTIADLKLNCWMEA
jgi:LytS/YehU family sensor histidine kinase